MKHRFLMLLLEPKWSRLKTCTARCTERYGGCTSLGRPAAYVLLLCHMNKLNAEAPVVITHCQSLCNVIGPKTLMASGNTRSIPNVRPAVK